MEFVDVYVNRRAVGPRYDTPPAETAWPDAA
jgi:hypothetical protein